MIKCNAHKCKKLLNPEKREVFADRIVKGTIKKGNKEIIIWEGWRFFCKEHHNFITSLNNSPDLTIVFGPKQGKRRFKRRDRK